jgi:probable rRNA maturation factor
MNDPGDSALSLEADDSQADLEPPERLPIDIVAESGDWSAFTAVEARIAEAAEALARHPRWRGAPGARATVVLADDALVRALNARYRGQDKPTNVLSFPFGDVALGLGDVVLAAETLAREAAEQDIPLNHHLQHLVVHGLLHLAGFGHDTDAQANEMEGIEVDVLASLGVPDPYASVEGR